MVWNAGRKFEMYKELNDGPQNLFTTGNLPADFPTSPHIMALHPALARTLVPRVTIDATGHDLDDALAERVADAFGDRLQEAHRRGLAKLALLQAMSGV